MTVSHIAVTPLTVTQVCGTLNGAVAPASMTWVVPVT
jgi:hypothetical protein